MEPAREALVQQVLDLQANLYRYLRPAREWLEVDLTMPQMKVLLVLYSENEASMGHLAQLLGVTLSTVTGIVDRLVERGLVVRQESPHDRRLVVCRLMPSGQSVAERMQQAGRSRMADLLQALSAVELGTVAAALQLLLDAAQRENASAKTPCLTAPGGR